MRKTLALLFVTSSLAALISAPAWSAMHVTPSGDAAPTTEQAGRVIVADADERSGESGVSKDGEHEDEGDDADGCDDDDGACGSAAKNPAPAGTVAPPQNGLFGSGAAPKVQLN
jgi:hypothetical protein